MRMKDLEVEDIIPVLRSSGNNWHLWQGLEKIPELDKAVLDLSKGDVGTGKEGIKPSVTVSASLLGLSSLSEAYEA